MLALDSAHDASAGFVHFSRGRLEAFRIEPQRLRLNEVDAVLLSVRWLLASSNSNCMGNIPQCGIFMQGRRGQERRAGARRKRLTLLATGFATGGRENPAKRGESNDG